MERIIIKYYPSPAGELKLGSYRDKLCICDWVTSTHPDRTDNRIKRGLKAEFVEGGSEVITRAIAELDEYFAHKRNAFDIPLLFVGTEFQKKVWNHLLGIPYGQTISYGEMARRLGHPKAFRAVANANGANAISIFVPCHRVIGSQHTLGGYGGGLDAKRVLLSVEQWHSLS